MLGDRISALRRKAGWSQKELAARLGVSPSAVGMYEQDRREPSAEKLVELSSLLGVSLDYLLTGRPDRQTPEAMESWSQSASKALAGACLRDAKGRTRPVSQAEIAMVQSVLPGGDKAMMHEALRLAEEAAAAGEAPVGCVVAWNGQIVGRGRNRREQAKNALAHAEIEAIDEACRTLGGWRLWQCTLYVTLEPCPMCAGAILTARIARVVYGAQDPKAGSCGSVCDLFCMSYNHRPRVEQGLMEEACSSVLRRFFRGLREEKKGKAR